MGQIAFFNSVYFSSRGKGIEMMGEMLAASYTHSLPDACINKENVTLPNFDKNVSLNTQLYVRFFCSFQKFSSELSWHLYGQNNCLFWMTIWNPQYGWNVSCLFLVSECAFYDGEVNCFGIASPPDVSVYCYQHHGIFSMSWWAPQKTIFYYFLPFPIIPTEKNLCQFRNKFHICHVPPPFSRQIDFFGIHTPPHHNYLNDGKMDVYNDNFVAGERVCKISRVFPWIIPGCTLIYLERK